jgi:ribosomal protein L11 methyltransferase
MNKNWQQLRLLVKRNLAATIADNLTIIGAVATTVAHDETDNLNNTIDEEIELIALFDESFERRIVNLLFDQDLSANWEIITPEHWQDKWKEDLEPIHFKQRLSVIPSWYDYQASSTTQDERVHLLLDSGQAFGSGAHATTYLCLEWLSNNLDNTKLVIDFGCGSGILAIAAKLLGATRVIATDCELVALETTAANAALNKVDIETYLPADLPAVTADLLIANILATTLVELYPVLTAQIKDHGMIVLAGILATQEANIRQIYEPAFKLTVIHNQEWILMFGKKQALNKHSS